MKRRVRWSTALAFILVVENAYLLFPVARDFALQTEESDAAHGRRIAATLGCFSCHGPEGRGNVPNLGSTFETVPGFTEQTLMMFVEDDQELAEYIVDGAPKRRLEKASYREQLDRQALHMPQFRGQIRDADVAALIAYLRLVSGLLRPPDGIATRGEQAVRELGCFSCHGEMGMGGQANPGSLKGYVPGFLGQDFHDLVRDDEELMTWLRDGALPRVSEHPIGRFFFARQRIRMPAYKGFVAEEKLEAVAAYVRWLAGGTWHTQPLLPSSGGTAGGAPQPSTSQG